MPDHELDVFFCILSIVRCLQRSHVADYSHNGCVLSSACGSFAFSSVARNAFLHKSQTHSLPIRTWSSAPSCTYMFAVNFSSCHNKHIWRIAAVQCSFIFYRIERFCSCCCRWCYKFFTSTAITIAAAHAMHMLFVIRNVFCPPSFPRSVRRFLCVFSFVIPF